MRGLVRGRLLDLHLYLGLLCAPYLVVYGVSAISFNHDWIAESRTSEREAVVDAISFAETADDADRAASIREALGLVGRIPARSVARGEDGSLHFKVGRPGRGYRVEWSEGQPTVRIEETHTGVLQVLRGLHGMRGLEGAALGTIWGIYTEISIWVLVFAVGSGIYLWSSRRDWIGWMMLGTGSAAFVAFSAAVW